MSKYGVIIKIVLYISLGALWSFSNIGYPLDFLSPLMLVPFLFFIRRETVKGGIVFSIIFGTSFYLTHLLWMPGSFVAFFSESDSGPGIYVAAWVITMIFSIYHGAMYAIIAMLMKLIDRRVRWAAASYLLIPVMVTVVEYFYPKYWVDRIGYSVYGYFWLMQTADLFGPPFLTFLVILSNAAILYILEGIMYKKRLGPALGHGAACILLVGASLIYGCIRVGEIESIARTAPKAKIGVVQGNFSGLDKRDNAMLLTMIRTYNRLSRELLPQSPDCIIWPESADPDYYDIHKKDFSEVITVPVPHVFGTNLSEGDVSAGTARYYNSLVFTTKKGTKVDHYLKRKLLPFIEDFPVQRFNFIMRWYGFDYFTRGTEYKLFKLGALKIAPDICYEDIIPGYIRKSIYVNGDAANLLVNATNNSWFGKGTEPLIHYRMVGFRAIENRRSYASATCTGYSSIFDPCGRPMYVSGLFTREAFVREVPLLEIKTVYEGGGWLFPYFLGALLILQMTWIAVRIVSGGRR